MIKIALIFTQQKKMIDNMNKNIYQKVREILGVSDGDKNVDVKQIDEEYNSNFLDIELHFLSFTQFQFQLHMCETLMVSKLQHSILNPYENQVFFNYSLSKVFLSSSMFVLLSEKMSPQSKAYANIQIIEEILARILYLTFIVKMSLLK